MQENHFLCYFLQLSASNSMHAELIEDDGESRYQITDIIGEWVSGFLLQVTFGLSDSDRTSANIA